MVHASFHPLFNTELLSCVRIIYYFSSIQSRYIFTEDNKLKLVTFNII